MVNQIQTVFTSLADPTRAQVVALLSRDSLPAGKLARACGMSGPAMSRHLRVLRRNGIVDVVQSSPHADARVRMYRLRPEAFRSLKEWIDHMQVFWDSKLAAFKSYAEENDPPSGKKTKGRKK